MGSSSTEEPVGEVARKRILLRARGAVSARDRFALAPLLGDVGNRYGLLLAWIVVVVIFGILSPDIFLTTSNFQTIFGSQAVLLVVTLGLIIPLTAGEFDLSVAGVLGISQVLVGFLNVEKGWPIVLAILVALAVGLGVGLLHVFLILKLDLESIVVTLGTGTLLIGAGFGINNSSVGGISDGLVNAARTQILGIQAAFWYALLLTVIIWYVFSYTPLGRYIYFVGAGREVARLSGIRVDYIRGGSLIAASVLAALAGVLVAGIQGASDPNVGANYLLPAFAGAFLGATAITPGRFNPWGSFIAVYFLVTGITGLQMQGLSGWIEQVFYGGSLVVAVTFSKLASRKRAT